MIEEGITYDSARNRYIARMAREERLRRLTVVVPLGCGLAMMTAMFGRWAGWW
jgi:fatty acid desaturase